MALVFVLPSSRFPILQAVKFLWENGIKMLGDISTIKHSRMYETKKTDEVTALY